MYRVSGQFITALSHTHDFVTRVDAFDGGRRVASDLPITGGTVQVSAGSGVHRKLDLTVADPALWDVLSGVGVELRVWRGIQYPGGSREMVPLGVFGIDQQSAPVLARGEISIFSAPDRWARVQRGRFESPRASEPLLTCVQQLVNLVYEVAPNTPDTSGVTLANPLSELPTSLQVWERDRDKACTELAAAAGAECFFGPLGQLVVRDIPVMDARPAWKVHAGEGGVLINGTATRDRTRVYNVIVVSSGKTDGSLPYTPQVVADVDPASPTNVNTGFGRVPYFLTSATARNAVDARAQGRALLAKTRGRFIDASCEAVTNPALESGDTISVTGMDGNSHLYLLDSFSVPLGAEGGQALTLRSLAAVSGDSAG